MNLVIIGAKSAQKLTEIVRKSFDDLNVFPYLDINIFMQEASLRSMEVHRLILLQDGIDDVSDDNVYDFVDFLAKYYPSIRVITINKDMDTTKFLGGLLTSSTSHVHFCSPSITNKMVIDLVASGLDELRKRYSKVIYKKEAESYTNIIDDIDTNSEEKSDEPEVKRGFLSKVFGTGPKGKKKNKSVSKKGGLQPIGQGQGVEQLTELESTIFDTDDTNNEELQDTEELQDADSLDYSMFDVEEGDIGVGFVPGIETEKTIFDIDEDEAETEFSDTETPESFDNLDELGGFFGVDNDVDGDDEELDNTDFESVEDEYDGGSDNNYETPPLNNIEKIKRSMAETTIEGIEDFKFKKPRPKIDLEDIDDTPLDLGTDMSTIMDDYEEHTTKTKVKVVEKVIKVAVKEGKGIRNRNGVRIILVTGDRRTGMTKLSMNLANIFAKQEKTLLVDFDRYRKGVISYIGVEDLIDEPEHIQNSLNHVRNEKMLQNITYLYPKGGFYCLFSLYGEEIDDEQMSIAQKVISNQKEYTTVIIDCPMENLYLMDNLLYNSNILICIEDDKVGIINTVINLNSSVDDEFMPHLYNNSSLVIGRGSNIDKFKSEMAYVETIFGLDETPYNWGSLDIAGTIKGTKKLAEGLVM